MFVSANSHICRLVYLHNFKVYNIKYMYYALRFNFKSAKPVYASKLFRTIEAIPKESIDSNSCKSFKMMLRYGLISSSSSGIYNFLPLTVMALEKLCDLVDGIMKSINGQKILLPTLAHSSFWKTSGRWENLNTQLFKLTDRHSIEYCLGPTHEEIATKLVADYNPAFKHLPLRLYQISTKFRDEMKPRLGLMRGREFLMKDMYTFDETEEAAMLTYDTILNKYEDLFDLLKLDCIKIKASNAGIGGTKSHEFHLVSDIGEDRILCCTKCKQGINLEISDQDTRTCTSCGSALEVKNGIEVGHLFHLGTTYSEPFKAQFKTSDGTMSTLHMGCYGLGLTRILATSIECLSTTDRIRWPMMIAPFLVSIIPPKKGSKESAAQSFTDYLMKTLSSLNALSNNIIIDDRTTMTIGKRLQEANYLGIQYAVVLGSTVLQDVPKFEIIDCYSKETLFLTHAETMKYFRDIDMKIWQHFDNYSNKEINS